jgi:isoleucyl-tRNA synthetase
VGHNTIKETVRKVLLTYWNSVSFQALYARVNNWMPGTPPAVAQRHVLDRWLVSRTQSLIQQVTTALENFDTLRAGTAIQEFIDELSNWYVRRSRRRFWDGDNSALSTLHETLDVLTRLMAPITPFITERVWQDLFLAAHERTGSTDPLPDSVHLTSWPQSDASLVAKELESSMALTQRLVELGRSARSEASIKIRQPLARALVSSSSLQRLSGELIAEITNELNIESLESFSADGDLVTYAAKGNFRALGKRFGRDTAQVAAKIAEADPAAVASQIQTNGEFTLDDGTTISAEEVLISERPKEGWSVVGDQSDTLALDVELTQELIHAGWVREVIRGVQELRKNSGLDVSDRIVLKWTGSGEQGEAIRAGQDFIASEVLATIITEEETEGAATDEDLGISYWLTRV